MYETLWRTDEVGYIIIIAFLWWIITYHPSGGCVPTPQPLGQVVGWRRYNCCIQWRSYVTKILKPNIRIEFSLWLQFKILTYKATTSPLIYSSFITGCITTAKRVSAAIWDTTAIAMLSCTHMLICIWPVAFRMPVGSKQACHAGYCSCRGVQRFT